MAYVDFKSKAIDLVREAVAADNAGKYEDAFKAYMGSLEYFSAHLKYEKNPAQKQSITHKVRGHPGDAQRRLCEMFSTGYDPFSRAFCSSTSISRGLKSSKSVLS